MKKTNLKLSQLIETMRAIAAEGNHFVKGDAFHDIVKIAGDKEEIDDLDIEDEYKEGVWHWCLRKNGTTLGEYASVVEEFEQEHLSEAVAAYKIHYKDGRFSIETVKDFGNEFFDL